MVIMMDDKTKDMFTESFGPNTIFDDDDIHAAAKRMMPFVWERMKPCTHEVKQYQFPMDPRFHHNRCKCGKTDFITMTKACHDEILADKDLRNFENHKVKDGKIIEFAGVEVRIV